ncbi:MAG: 4Fe-4S binding protein [Candidatus Heimdallarchaeota archaeon]|nr:4Fe-4S binding protein [Candidatus Heimdallarchaeota archaeon]
MTDEGPKMPILYPMEGSAGRTGDWRIYRPIVDPDKCKKCNICWQYCPDLAITAANKEEDRAIVYDYEYCKGCGICAKECPFGAITMVREEGSD